MFILSKDFFSIRKAGQIPVFLAMKKFLTELPPSGDMLDLRLAFILTYGSL